MKAEVYEQIAQFVRQMEDSAELLKKIALAVPEETEALKVAEVHLLELRADVMYQILWFLHEEETEVSGVLYEERRRLQRRFFDPKGNAGDGIDHLLPPRLPENELIRRREPKDEAAASERKTTIPERGRSNS